MYIGILFVCIIVFEYGSRGIVVLREWIGKVGINLIVIICLCVDVVVVFEVIVDSNCLVIGLWC